MATTHMEFADAVPGLRCPTCTQRTMRETVLVNPYGLVLARHTSCVHCGHLRHRARSARRTVHSGLTSAVAMAEVA